MNFSFLLQFVPNERKYLLYLRIYCIYRFTDDEVLQLHDLYADYGNNWKMIGQLMKRSGPACRDKWRITHQEFGSIIISVICLHLYKELYKSV